MDAGQPGTPRSYEVDYMRQFYREWSRQRTLVMNVWRYGLENSGLRVTFDWNLRWKIKTCTWTAAQRPTCFSRKTSG